MKREKKTISFNTDQLLLDFFGCFSLLPLPIHALTVDIMEIRLLARLIHCKGYNFAAIYHYRLVRLLVERKRFPCNSSAADI